MTDRAASQPTSGTPAPLAAPASPSHPISTPGTPDTAPRAGGRGLSGRLSLALAAELFVGLAVLLTWPRLANATTSVVDFGDPLEDVWTLRWINQALLTDPARLYDAPIFQGFPRPLAYDDITLGQALLTLPVTALTGNLVLAYNLLIILSFALAGWCAFVLARHVTGSALAGVIAGMVYGFWSYTFAHLSHLSVLSLYPIPLALLCLHQVFASATPSVPAEHPPVARAAAAPRRWAAGVAAC
jgi:hypothetical protein